MKNSRASCDDSNEHIRFDGLYYARFAENFKKEKEQQKRVRGNPSI
jgi:hypothetical protein